MTSFDGQRLKKFRRRHAPIRKAMQRKIEEAKKQCNADCRKAALATTSIEELVAIFEITQDGMAVRNTILNRLAGLCSTVEKLQETLSRIPRNRIYLANPLREKLERLYLKQLERTESVQEIFELLYNCPPDDISVSDTFAANWREIAIYRSLAKIISLQNSIEAVNELGTKIKTSVFPRSLSYRSDRFTILCEEKIAALRAEESKKQ